MSDNATVHRAIYRVTGMTCEHCANAIRQEVGAVDGVTTVHVELSTGDVTVESGRPPSCDEVATAVDEAGYALAG